VTVAVDLPRLELDRPFTYLVPEGEDAGVGTLVSVPFHGRTVKGWILGPTDDVPKRVLPIRRILSRAPIFRDTDLRVYRWVSERYVAPLATVIRRAHPPRVASEEDRTVRPAAEPSTPRPPNLLSAYPRGSTMVAACAGGSGAFVLRPLPDHEAGSCLEAVAACVMGGRDAIVLVPESEPLPETARAVAEAFGGAALVLAGGDRRHRYRAWLDIVGGRYRVVVGTRPAVFASLPRLGLVWVNREAHPGHREARSPYYHVREIALSRARLQGAVCVLSAHCPSAEAVALADAGDAVVVRAPRAAERAAAPLVEAVRPERQDITPRLASALRSAEGAFFLESRRGYGIARVCRTCGRLARCVACGSGISVREGQPICMVCGAAAPCSSCGGTRFGVDRGGTERVQEWAEGLTESPVHVVESAERARVPAPGSVVVGTAAAVKDFGPRRVGLVAVLDADRARTRAGISAPEQALATWMEAALWAGPKGSGGRVLVQTTSPADPAIQALVRWDPWHFHRHERQRREEAGFPPGFPVFRVLGGAGLDRAVTELDVVNALVSRSDGETVSLVTLHPDAVSGFRRWVLRHLEDGAVTRVEAEPQL
jgi:primosomal protein N' (replication factor Y) (superfamily II helicase)